MYKKGKHTWQDYLIIILLIITSSNVTSTLSTSLSFLVFSFIYITIVYFYRRGKITLKLRNITIFLVTLSLIYYFKFQSFHPIFTFKLFSYVYMPFMVINLLGDSFYLKFVNIVYILSLISLPLYLFQLIDFTFVYNIIDLIQNSIPLIARNGNQSSNILIWGLQGRGAELRNSGFMWEPGAFAAMLLLPIMFELTNNKFNLNRKIIIMVIALVSTLSTMGYVGLLIIYLFYLYNNKTKRNYKIIVLLPLGIITAIIVTQLSFMQQKISNSFQSVEYVIDLNIAKDGHASFGRFGSAVMDYKTWKKNPIFGIGGQDEEIEFSTINSYKQGYVNRTNGDSEYLVRFGLIGVAISLILLAKSFSAYTKKHAIRGSGLFLLIVVVLGFSNTILFTPLFMIFQISFFTTKK